MYEDDIDGVSYESDSPTEEEQEEDDIYEVKKKTKGKQLKPIEQPKKFRKAITKSIKM